MYYLNSRYYDPEIGRFVNADDISFLSAKYFNGLNLYTYCINNPIKNVDISGNFFFTALLVTLAIVTAGTALGIVISNGTIGFESRYKGETAVSSQDYFTHREEQGIGYDIDFSSSKSPITFFVVKPTNWWRFWEYSIGVDVNINGYGATLSLGEENQISFNSLNSSTEIGISLFGNIIFNKVVREEGIFTYFKTIIKFPKLAACLVSAYYGASYLITSVPNFLNYFQR